jgi:hypothetical protein
MADDSIDEIRAAQTIGTAAARRRRITFFRGLAAAAVLATVVAGTWILAQRSTDEYTPRVLVALVDPGVTRAPGWNEPPWRVMRGGDGAALTDRQLAFRLGVHLANLEAAERAADPAAIRAATVDVATLVERLPGGSAYAALYRELSNVPAGDARRRELRRTGWEAVAEALPSAELQLGAWIGAARLALLTGNAGWFTGPIAQQTRRRVRTQDLDTTTRGAWEAVLRSLDQARIDLVRERLDRLIRAAAG